MDLTTYTLPQLSSLLRETEQVVLACQRITNDPKAPSLVSKLATDEGLEASKLGLSLQAELNRRNNR